MSEPALEETPAPVEAEKFTPEDWAKVAAHYEEKLAQHSRSVFLQQIFILEIFDILEYGEGRKKALELIRESLPSEMLPGSHEEFVKFVAGLKRPEEHASS